MLPDRAILAAYRLKCFEATEHPYASLIDNDTVALIHGVTALYEPPVSYQSSTTSSSRQTREESTSELGYPPTWATTRSSLSSAVRIFRREAEAIRSSTVFQNWLATQDPASPIDSLLSGSSSEPNPFSAGRRLRRSLPSPTANSDLDNIVEFPSRPHTPSEPNNSEQDQGTSEIGSHSTENIDRRHSTGITSATPQPESNMEDHRPPHPGMTPQDHAAIAQNLLTMMGQVYANNAGANQEQANPINRVRPSWRSDEVGYFNPHLDAAMGTGDIVQSGKDTYYRNVYLFIDRIRDAASVRGGDVVRANLSTCLRGSAQEWYSFELTQLERDALRGLGEGVDQRIQALEKRFKPSILISMTALTSEKYSLADARNRREPASFVQPIIRHAKGAGFDSVKAQLTYAWNQIDVKLKRDILKPNDNTTTSSFIQGLKAKKEI